MMRRSCRRLVSQSIAQKLKHRDWPASVSHILLNRVHTVNPSNGEWYRIALTQHIPTLKVRNVAFILENGGSQAFHAAAAASSTLESAPDKKSLNQRIHLLRKIPFGRMNESHLQQARSFLFIVSRYKNEQGAKLSEALLERLYVEQSTRATVDTEMYNACINAWNSSGADGTLVVNNVERIFARMEQRCNDESNIHATTARPDRITYNSVLNCYSKCKEDYAFKVHAILDKMNDVAAWENYSDADDYALKVKPDEITYNSVMNYYASRNNEHYAAQQVESLLLKMSELTQQPHSNIRITSTSFNIAIKAWSNAGVGLDGADRAKALLLMMIKWRDKGHDVEPTAISFSTVIDAYSKVSREHATTAIDNAMELLDTMEASSITDLDHINSCYNAAANVLIKMKSERVGEKVRQLMLRMKNMDATPDEFMFVRCVEAYASETSDDWIHKANELFEEMIEQLECNPSSLSFNSLLKILVKMNTDQSIGLAEQLLERMHSLGGDSRPDVASYSMIIGALSHSSSPNPEHKALDYLRRMLRSYNIDHYLKAKPTSFVFNCIINMLDRSNDERAATLMYSTLMSMENQHRQGNDSVCPDTITYNTVIAKLAKSPSKDNAKKVMKLLAQMQKHEESENIRAAPDIITYTSVVKLQKKLDPSRAASIVSAYLRRVLAMKELPPIDKNGLRTLLIPLSRQSEPQDARLALQIWERIECCSRTSKVLDSDLCNLVVMTFSRAKYDESADTVLRFLSERFRRFQAGDESVVLPTVIGMNAVFSFLASRGRMNDAIAILDVMRALSKKCRQLQPDDGCYRSVMFPLAIDRFSTKKNAVYAESITKRAKEDFGVIPISVLNAAINVCAYTLEDEGGSRAEAMKVAFGLFEQAREAGTYSTVTFGVMIKACVKLSNDESTKFKLVQVCCCDIVPS